MLQPIVLLAISKKLSYMEIIKTYNSFPPNGFRDHPGELLDYHDGLVLDLSELLLPQLYEKLLLCVSVKIFSLS